MPVLIVYGVPAEVTEESLERLTVELKTYFVKVFRIPGEQTSVFFPADRYQQGLGEELVCFIDGFSDKPMLADSTRKNLATSMMMIFVDFAKVNILHCGRVEVFVGSNRADATSATVERKQCPQIWV